MKHFLIILFFGIFQSLLAQQDSDTIQSVDLQQDTSWYRSIENEQYDDDPTYEEEATIEYDNEADFLPAPPLPDYIHKPLDSIMWKSLTKDLNYEDFSKIKEQSKNKKEDKSINFPNIAPIIKFVGILLLLGLLLYFALKWYIHYRKIPNDVIEKLNISIEEAEVNLPISELESLIKNAIDQNQFNLAIRLYFLKVIQILNNNNYIVWQRYKTNKAYLSECQKTDFHYNFKTLIDKYEKYWFGDKPLDKTTFEALQLDFLTFYKTLGQNGK